MPGAISSDYTRLGGIVMYNPTGVYNEHLGAFEPDEEKGKNYLVIYKGYKEVFAASEEEAKEAVSSLDIDDWEVEVEK